MFHQVASLIKPLWCGGQKSLVFCAAASFSYVFAGPSLLQRTHAADAPKCSVCAFCHKIEKNS
jgi:hypothetical protein